MITYTLALASGVIIFPVSELPAHARSLARDDDSFALTRMEARGTTKLIDADTAALLTLLRVPIRLVDAVIGASEAQGIDPHLFLDQIYPTVQRLLSQGLVVVADPEEMAAPLRSGDVIGSFTLGCCQQTLDDVSVYRAQTLDGQTVAVKVAVDPKDEAVRHALEREAAVLHHLTGPHVPELVWDGSGEERPYLATEWFDGVSSLEWARRVRRPWQLGAERELIDGIIAIAAAYADLHGQGVVHADVHPRNVLVCDSVPKILDFSLSLIPGHAVLGSAVRGGVFPFYEPEWATAALSGGRVPPASRLSDQFALGALLYLLMTGSSHVLSADQRRTMRQIADSENLPFDHHGLPSHPEFEGVLAKAMAKDPVDRFESVEDFAGAIREASGVDRRPMFTSPGLAKTVEARLGRNGALIDRGLPAPPFCSVNYGGAGIAFFWYRLGVLREDPRHLLDALRWIDYASRVRRRADAFGNLDLQLTPRQVGDTSIYHSMAGVHCVAALIFNAMGNAQAAADAATDFVAASHGTTEKLELVSGRASSLLAAALLVEALGSSSSALPEGLQTFGDQELARTWGRLGEQGLDDSELRYWGIAHGWAGVLYATLRWSEATGLPLPSSARDRLVELAGRATIDGTGLAWVGPNDPGLPGSWCHGTAGYTHLWAAAERVIGDGSDAGRALGAAEHCWSTPSLNENLCCGASGQAYAMLEAYRVSKDEMWLARAEQLAARSLEWVGTTGSHTNALYKGDVGIALLVEDLRAPGMAAMPLFGSEHWPTAPDILS